MRERDEEPSNVNVRHRYSSTIPSQAREITPPSAVDPLNTYEPRRSRMTRVPPGLPIRETDMMCPPSLTSCSSAMSIESQQLVLGTPQFHPEFYHQLPATADYPCSDPLDAKIEVAMEPNGGDRLEMFGTSKTGTSYSLPGHVMLTVPNLGSSAESQGRLRVVKELKVTFEGKTEFCDDAGRYQVMRLVKTEASLLPTEGFELPSRCDGANSQSFSKETAYAIPFDLKIPGWLPQSFENDTVALSYGLVATVKLGWSAQAVQPKTLHEVDDPMDVDSVTATSSSPVPIMLAASQSYSSRFFPRLAKSVASALATAITLPSFSASQQVTRASEWKPIAVTRHRVPAPPCGTSLFSTDNVAETPLRHYTLRPAENSPSPVECVVSVPETIDINGPTLRVSVRLRARNGFTIASLEGEEEQPSSASEVSQGQVAMNQSPPASAAAAASPAVSPQTPVSKSECVQKDEQIRMVELGMEVEETERYSTSPAQTFMSAYPIPEDQPSECSPYHGSSALFSPPSRLSSMSMFGLTSSKTFKATRTRTLLLGEDGKSRTYRFDGDGLELGSGWRKVNIIIPMPASDSESTSPDDINRKPSGEIDTPFLRIKHKLKIRIVCRSRALPGQDTIVVLTTPLRCGTAPQPRPSVSITPSAQILQSGPSQVPAYCQIFHENGTAREDEEALPLYEPDSPPAYTSSFSSTCLSGLGFQSTSPNPLPLSDIPAIPEAPLDAIIPARPSRGIADPQQLDAFAPISAGVVDTTGNQTKSSVPGPRGCRSVSSLSTISEAESSDDSQEDSVSSSSVSSPLSGRSSELPHVGYLDFPALLENRLVDVTDRSSSEAILPEFMDAARQRAVSRAKHYRPSPSRLSESITNN